MSKSELTVKIEEKLFERLGRKEFGCKEVTIGWYGREVVDFITYSIDKDREIRCFEIKVSKKDFYSKNNLTFIGHRNYFVMPLELYDEVRIELIKNFKNIGVYVLDGNDLVVAKNAVRIELRADKEIILSSIARSMQREWFKSLNTIDVLNQKLSDSEDKNKYLKEEFEKMEFKINENQYI